MKAIYQWILRDHQELSFPRFCITDEYFATPKELEDYFSVSLYQCFSIIEKYIPSKISDDHMIERIKGIQNERKSSGSKDK